MCTRRCQAPLRAMAGHAEDGERGLEGGAGVRVEARGVGGGPDEQQAEAGVGDQAQGRGKAEAGGCAEAGRRKRREAAVERGDEDQREAGGGQLQGVLDEQRRRVLDRQLCQPLAVGKRGRADEDQGDKQGGEGDAGVEERGSARGGEGSPGSHSPAGIGPNALVY